MVMMRAPSAMGSLNMCRLVAIRRSLIVEKSPGKARRQVGKLAPQVGRRFTAFLDVRPLFTRRSHHHTTLPFTSAAALAPAMRPNTAPIVMPKPAR